ncbi:hypothetical protein L1887_58627 [Cichorium endivia]|nr:hypothetical protein L1887_58627 [Cichorium endivia]
MKQKTKQKSRTFYLYAHYVHRDVLSQPLLSDSYLATVPTRYANQYALPVAASTRPPSWLLADALWLFRSVALSIHYAARVLGHDEESTCTFKFSETTARTPDQSRDLYCYESMHGDSQWLC